MEAQTYEYRTRSTQCKREAGTQMEKARWNTAETRLFEIALKWLEGIQNETLDRGFTFFLNMIFILST